MAQKETQYKRRISSEEARKGRIFVLQDSLDFFPPVGKSFAVQSNGVTKDSRVETYHCECRGPQLPHNHYFIRWEGLRFGDRVLIQADEDPSKGYTLSIDR